MTIKYQHQLFADAYLSHHNATQAYKDAGYKATGNVAETAASRLLRNVQVASYIADQQATSAQLASINQSWVLKCLVDNVDRAMQAVQVIGKDGEPTGEYTYNGAVANKSLELIGQEIGMFKKQVEHSGNINHNVTPGVNLLRQMLDAKLITIDQLRALPSADVVDVEGREITDGL